MHVKISLSDTILLLTKTASVVLKSSREFDSLVIGKSKLGAFASSL